MQALDLVFWELLEGALQIERRLDAPNVGDEVEHRHSIFAFPQAKATPELLHENPSAVRHPQEADDVHVGHIDALVEQINCGDDRNAAVAKLAHQDVALAL